MLLNQPSDPSRPYNLLVLCTGNSARSILGEALFNERLGCWFKAFSAGSRPTGQVNPFALERLTQEGIAIENFRSKSWDEFGRPEAPPLDFVMTVCGNAACELCPEFKGDFQRIHWGLPDPAEFTADPVLAREAFKHCFERLQGRIKALAAQPLADMTKAQIAECMAVLAEDNDRI